MAARPFPAKAIGLAILGLGALALAGCTGSEIPKQLKPVPPALVARMDQLAMKETSQIFIRIFKEESQLEVWKERADGAFALLKTYEICKWSGVLGPKKVEGDRQAPEGFYTVTPAQMNPKSSYYLSFNIGYPNAYDRSLGRTGAHLMVHGACSSAGCYSMTDEDAGELFALARDSFRGGQTSFQIQAFPFRLTPENLARHRDNPNMPFWRMLKTGYDTFELTRKPPKVDVCDKRYVFNADGGSATFDGTRACPAFKVPEQLVAALDKKKAEDDAKTTKAVAALQEEARRVAAEKQAAAEEAVAAERRAAERAANPSLVSRLMGAKPVEPPGAAIPIVPAAAAKAPARIPAIAAVPVPKVKPAATDRVAAPATLVKTVPEPAAVAAPALPPGEALAAPAESTGGAPTVGTFVNKKFDWPDT